MRLRASCAAIAVMHALAASPVFAVRIGLFADPGGTRCSLDIPPSTGATLYLLAILDDTPANAIKAFEVQITGMPQNWFPSSNVNGQVTSIGSILQGGGLYSYWSCQTSSNRILQLGTVSVFNSNAATNVVLRVEPAIHPSNSSYRCPLIALCDLDNECVPETPLPKYSKQCVEGLETYINGGGPCTVDADPFETASRLFLSPNPSLGPTTVRFAAPPLGEVELTVHDVAGRCVRRLLAGHIAPGAGTISWDGRDDAGHDVAAGVYVVRFRSRAATSQGRVTLLR